MQLIPGERTDVHLCRGNTVAEVAVEDDGLAVRVGAQGEEQRKWRRPEGECRIAKPVLLSVYPRQAGSRAFVEGQSELGLRHGCVYRFIQIFNRFDEMRLTHNDVSIGRKFHADRFDVKQSSPHFDVKDNPYAPRLRSALTRSM